MCAGIAGIQSALKRLLVFEATKSFLIPSASFSEGTLLCNIGRGLHLIWYFDSSNF